MPHIFISYSHENQGYAHSLADYLIAHGFDIWIDDRNRYGDRNWYGDQWIFALEEAVDASAAVIIVMTPESRRSRWVRLEIQRAINKEKPIFPLLLDGELWGVISHLQALPVTDGSLPNDEFLTNLASHVMPHQDDQGTNVAPSSDNTFSPVRGLEDVPFPVPPGMDSLGLNMIPVEAGPFRMGTLPQQLLDITDRNVLRWARQTEHAQELALPAYAVSKHPITVRDYRLFVDAGGYHIQRYWTAEGWEHRRRGTWEYPLDWSLVPGEDIERMPVVGISWYEADAFCRWLSEQTGTVFTLPGEAEWEKAARGSDGFIFPWGNEWQSGRCNTIDAHIEADERANHHRQVEPVGLYSPDGDSVYGVSDMSGNVWEWCADVFQMVYDPERVPNPSDRDLRVVRGGAYYMNRHVARAAYRHKLAAFSRLRYVGFRTCEQLE